MKPALLITIITILAGTVRLPAADTPPPADQTIPLGVYWAGEMVGSAYDNNPVKRKAELEKRFADLAAHNVTAIWLTHTDAKEGAEMARMAGKHGIRLVASLGPLAMEVGGIPDEEHAKATRKMLVEDWGDAPAPFAWGIGDEPSTTYMEEVAKASANQEGDPDRANHGGDDADGLHRRGEDGELRLVHGGHLPVLQRQQPKRPRRPRVVDDVLHASLPAGTELGAQDQSPRLVGDAADLPGTVGTVGLRRPGQHRPPPRRRPALADADPG